MVKKVNPWAVCTAKVGRENKDKYERCVMGIKSKYDIKESIANAIVKSLNEKRRSQDPQGGTATAPRPTSTPKIAASKSIGASMPRGIPIGAPRIAARGAGVGGLALTVAGDAMMSAYKSYKSKQAKDLETSADVGAARLARIRKIDAIGQKASAEKAKYDSAKVTEPSDASFKKSDVKVSDAPYRRSEPKAAASEAPKVTSKATPTNTPDQSKPPSSGTPTKNKPRKSDDNEGADCKEVSYDPDNPLFSGKSVFNKKVCKPKKSWRDDNSMKYSNEFKQIFESKITEGIFSNILKKAKGIGKAAWAGAKDIAKDIPGNIIRGTGRAWLAQTKQIPGLGYISSKVQDKAIDEPEKNKERIAAIMKRKNDPKRKARFASKEKYRASKEEIQDIYSRPSNMPRTPEEEEKLERFNRNYPGWQSGKYDDSIQLLGQKIVEGVLSRVNEMKVNPMIDRKEVRRMKAAGVSKKARREFTKDDVARKESDKKIKASMGPNNPKNTFKPKPKLNNKYIERGKKGKSETPMTKAQIDRSGTGGKPAAGRPGQTKAGVLKAKLAKIDRTSTAFMANLAKNPKNSEK